MSNDLTTASDATGGTAPDPPDRPRPPVNPTDSGSHPVVEGDVELSPGWGSAVAVAELEPRREGGERLRRDDEPAPEAPDPQAEAPVQAPHDAPEHQAESAPASAVGEAPATPTAETSATPTAETSATPTAETSATPTAETSPTTTGEARVPTAGEALAATTGESRATGAGDAGASGASEARGTVVEAGPVTAPLEGRRPAAAMESQVTVRPGVREGASRPDSRRGGREGTGKLAYQPALDGLRAVAVLLVVGYHLGYSGLAGGFVGVEVFFVLSGWLVCALLMGEHRSSGRISLTGFWLRRARRLLPALVVTTLVTLAVATSVDPGSVADLRADAFAALTYHLNWRLILDHQSYFAAADGPSALQHLWSLSIEEQFYLVFPLLAAGVLARRRPGMRVAIVLLGVLVSTVLRFAWCPPGTDPSGIYFSTLTRAAGLLAGVFLGLFWVPRRLRPRSGRVAPRVLDLVALAGLGVIIWYSVSVTEQDRAAFRGAFTLVQGATLLLIAALVVPGPSLVGRALGARPLRWIGQRSYGIYLIHWPVIVFTARAPGQQPEEPWKVALQILGIGVLAALSYRLVETPIRRRGLSATVRRVHTVMGTTLDGRPAATCLALAAVIVIAGSSYGVVSDLVAADRPTESHAGSVVISSTEAAQAASATPTTTAPPTSAQAQPTTTVAPGGAPAGAQPQPAQPGPPAPPPAPAYPRTTAVGDSVMAGGADALAQRMGPSLSLDAQVGRQMEEAPALFHQLAAAGQLGDVVVLHLGNNGPFTDAQIDDVFATIGPDRRVVLVNVFVPRRWEGEVNDRLQSAAARHPNARIADWRSVPAGNPALLAEDGYHLNADGAQRYADVVTAAVAAG